MVLRHLESPHGLKEGILKEDYTKEEGDKGVEGSLKACNNLVVNVGRRGSMYVKFSSLKPNLVWGEDVTMSHMVKVNGNLWWGYSDRVSNIAKRMVYISLES